jgi:hypothetical protein
MFGHRLQQPTRSWFYLSPQRAPAPSTNPMFRRVQTPSKVEGSLDELGGM